MDVNHLVQQYYINAKKAVKNVVNKYKQNKTEKEDEKLINTILQGFPGESHNMVKPMLLNQINYIRTLGSSGTSIVTTGFTKVLITGIVPRIIKHLLVLRDVIGIQPMNGPVGLVYIMRYVFKKVLKEKQPNSQVLDDLVGIQPMNLEVVSRVVEAATRKFQAGFSIEAIQDMKAHPKLDFELELVSVLSQELISEITSEISNDLVTIASQNEITVINSESDWNTPNKFHRSVQHLMFAINKQSADIARTTRRGPGNFIITDPSGLSLLQSQRHFKSNTFKGTTLTSFLYAGDITTEPTDNNEERVLYKVYVLPMLAWNQAHNVSRFLIGYKGVGAHGLDAGYIYAPYIIAALGGMNINEFTFVPTRTLITRYGKWFSTESAPTDPIRGTSKDYYRIVDFVLTDPESTIDEV